MNNIVSKFMHNIAKVVYLDAPPLTIDPNAMAYLKDDKKELSTELHTFEQAQYNAANPDNNSGPVHVNRGSW